MLFWLQKQWILWDLQRTIRQRGWTAIYVPGDAEAGGFAYTVGLRQAAASPEIVVSNIPIELGNGLIGEAVRQLQAGELTLADGAVWPLDWDGGAKMVWKRVHPDQIASEYFNLARWWREKTGAPDLDGFQLVLSDLADKMPWEDGYDPAYGRRQKELWRL